MDKAAKLSLRVQQDLTERSKLGLWAHPVCIIMLAVTTGLLRRAPLLMYLAIVSSVVQAALRRRAMRLLTASPAVRQRATERMQLGLLLSCASLWGMVAGIAVHLFGCYDPDVLTVLLYHAAVAFATAHVMVHERRLIAAACGLLFGPLMLGYMLFGEAQLLRHLCAAVVYLVYYLIQGNKLNKLYHQQISDNYELSVAAYRDCLTGLPNRLYMNELLEACIDEANAKAGQIALLYIDLDGFKQINDRHSHKVGDMFLCEVAARIRNCLRAGDVAARIGGDEFTSLLPECGSEKEAIGLAQRILSTARKPVTIDGHRLSYSTSIGVSVFPHMASSADLLVRSADEAMYAAKMSGKDRVCLAPQRGGPLLPGGEYEMPLLTFCSIGGMSAPQLAAGPYVC